MFIKVDSDLKFYELRYKQFNIFFRLFLQIDLNRQN